MFSSLKHPLAIGVTLIFQTLLVCIITALLAPSTWFSYILFLIFIGALLVLFIYVATLASNDMFKTSIKLFIIALIVPVAITSVRVVLDSGASITLDLIESSSFTSNVNIRATPPILTNIYNPASFIITNFIILFLLLTLIVVVKLSSNDSGPLRKT